MLFLNHYYGHYLYYRILRFNIALIHKQYRGDREKQELFQVCSGLVWVLFWSVQLLSE